MQYNRMLVFADVHGNYDGLILLIERIRKNYYKKIVCLGDVVGYGAEPGRCFEALQEIKDLVILKGNHEAMLCGEIYSKKCSNLGALSAEWTKKVCSNEIVEKAKELPTEYRHNGILFCHTGEINSGTWNYLNCVEDIKDAFGGKTEQIIFYGHTHRMRYSVINAEGQIEEDRLITKNEKVVIYKDDEKKYCINVGSVGQQRDKRTDCGYVEVVEKKDKMEIFFIRKRYKDWRAYYKIAVNGCGIDCAQYLIRETWKKKLYKILLKIKMSEKK